MQQINYKIVIPSYKRSETITKKTLNTLKQCKINPKVINIFVANEEEYAIYKKRLNPESYNELILGVETLHKQRNFIRNYYGEGEHLFYLDDDIEGFYKLKKGKLEPFYELDKLIQYGFILMKKQHTNLMGIYPVFNHFFMSQDISQGLYYIIGCTYWNINKKNPILNVLLEDKEDYERTIKEYMYTGQVLRLNNITVKTNYYTEKGGMQETRTEERVTNSAKFLLKKYPRYVELNNARKKHTEIKFKKQPNNIKIKRGTL